MKFARFVDNHNRNVYVNPNSVAYISENDYNSDLCMIAFITNEPDYIHVKGSALSVAFTLSEASK